MHVDRSGSGTWMGAGGISSVGMDFRGAGERGLYHKKGKQTPVPAEGEKGMQSFSFQTGINLKK